MRLALDGVVGFEALPIGVALLDGDERIIGANAVFARWVGSPDVTGRVLDELMRPAEDFLDDAGDDGMLVVHAHDPERAALVRRTWSAAGTVITLNDFTRRWTAGRILRGSLALADRTRNRLQLVIDASIAFGEATTAGRLAEVLAATGAQAYLAEESAVYLADGLGRLELAAGSNPLERFVDGAQLTAAASTLRGVLKVSGPDEGFAVLPMLGRAMQAAGVHALIAAPLQHDGEFFGVFACFFRHPRSFDQEAAPLADALANQATQTLTTIRLQRRLEHAAMHDETTGLPNRRMLEEQSTKSQARQVGLIFVDLDGFKTVNDRLGHDLGDDVLREVGRRLRAAVRPVDVVARYGGDEFIVVCEGADESVAHEVAERVRHAIGEEYPFLPGGMRLGASVGISVGTVFQSVAPLDRLIRAADQAMYEAKTAGGNRITLARVI
jgi:diguanylate cyclase (GGDEF)-like protein